MSALVVAVRSLCSCTYHRPNVGGRLGQDARAVAEVCRLVCLNGLGPRCVEVVENDVGVGDDQVGLTPGLATVLAGGHEQCPATGTHVHLLNKIGADGKVDPVTLGSHCRTIR